MYITIPPGVYQAARCTEKQAKIQPCHCVYPTRLIEILGVLYRLLFPRICDILEEKIDSESRCMIMWLLFAILSSVFAALTSILAKVGIDGVNSNLATAIRTAVVLVMAWGMVFLTNAQSGITQIGRKSWIFLILSGLATGASWLCYYKALQMGEASKVVPIDKLSVVITLLLAFVFLHEKFTVKSSVGCVLIAVGTLVMVL